MRVPHTIVLLGVLGALAASPGAVPLALADSPVPAGLPRAVGEFGSVLARQLEQPPLTDARFVGSEAGPDGFTVLYFELRPYPYLESRLAYLVSRCVPLDELDPQGMGGGFVDGDPATDVELTNLRSDDQPACPSG